MTDDKELLVPSASAWHSWLVANHATSSGVWLVLKKKGGQVTELEYSAALDEAICFGWIDGQIAKRDDQSYLRRFTPRTKRSRWSAINVDNANSLINSGRMQPSGRAAIEEAKADGRWQNAYLGQAKAAVHSELSEELERNPIAKERFDSLSAAERFSIIYRINNIKNRDNRQRKILGFIDELNRTS